MLCVSLIRKNGVEDREFCLGFFIVLVRKLLQFTVELDDEMVRLFVRPLIVGEDHVVHAERVARPLPTFTK